MPKLSYNPALGRSGRRGVIFDSALDGETGPGVVGEYAADRGVLHGARGLVRKETDHGQL